MAVELLPSLALEDRAWLITAAPLPSRKSLGYCLHGCMVSFIFKYIPRSSSNPGSKQEQAKLSYLGLYRLDLSQSMKEMGINPLITPSVYDH